MGAAPVGTITKLLYESAHLSVDHFVSSGHVGASWQYAEHFHEAIQITVLSPQSSLQADWLTSSGSRRRKQISGSAICVTPALQPHSMEWEEAQGSVGILVSADLLGECSEGPELAIEERYGLHDPFLEHLWNLLIDARDAGAPITRLLAESTAIITLEHLRCQAGFRQDQSSVCHRLGQVIEYIHAHLNAELSIVELARIAQTSPFHFARNFKASTGTDSASVCHGPTDRIGEVASGRPQPVHRRCGLCFRFRDAGAPDHGLPQTGRSDPGKLSHSYRFDQARTRKNRQRLRNNLKV